MSVSKTKIAEGKYGSIYRLPKGWLMKKCELDTRQEKEAWDREVYFFELLQGLHITPLYKKKLLSRVRQGQHSTRTGSLIMRRWSMDMKRLGEIQRQHYFPFISFPVYNTHQVLAMLSNQYEAKMLGVINTDLKRDNLLWSRKTKRVCMTDLGFMNEFDQQPFSFNVGWPMGYYPKEDKKWVKKCKGLKEKFLAVFRKYPAYVALWEWEAEMIAMGVRVWDTSYKHQNSWEEKHGKLKFFTGLGEDLLPDHIRQAFVHVNPYISYCYRRSVREQTLMHPSRLRVFTKEDLYQYRAHHVHIQSI